MSSFFIITGASKGIGKALSYELAQANHNLILIARSEQELLTLKTELEDQFKIKVEILALDLTAATSIDHILNFIKNNQLSINGLINNAGYAVWGDFETQSLNQQLNMIQLNNTLLVELCYHILPLLKQQKKSYLLNVGSTAGYQSVPTLALYSASKSFVITFTRALAQELKGSNIQVSVLSPGSTATNFMDRAGMTTEKMIQQAQKVEMTPTDVAKYALKKLFAGQTEIIPGFINQFSVFMLRFLPKSLIETIAHNLYK
jgi:short-subunit dehydrogenase